MSIKSRRWLTAGIALIAVAVLWLGQTWWLPLLPGLGQWTLAWTAIWGTAVQTGADLLATLALLGGALASDVHFPAMRTPFPPAHQSAMMDIGYELIP